MRFTLRVAKPTACTAIICLAALCGGSVQAQPPADGVDPTQTFNSICPRSTMCHNSIFRQARETLITSLRALRLLS